ncbi:MAG: hypothetical protein HONBIEJF_02804 [Fimbriimonadaceae bacterium]|nr:hypothetical protein [Fimbriimonadaceae bacterium]
MKHFAVLGSILLAFGASALVGQEKVNLKRTYKQDDKASYKLSIKSEGSMDFKVNGRLLTKVISVKEATAEIEATIKELKIEGLPSAPDTSGDVVKKDTFDSKSMPQNLEFEEAAIGFVVQAILSVLPDKEVATAGDFKINWTSKDGKVSFVGDGKLVELGEKGGAKAFKVRRTMDVENGQGEPAKVKVESWHAVADGRLIEGDGTVEVEGMTVKISLAPDKN